ncbi:MAG: PLP-dependent transferase [Acidobacteria bacterium]|nr:PLP-dependent transferase [Acidobacteriota bacterium]MCG2816146.1 PLP-dependent transferase [Candidatus Aminicenantes bacterium]MBU1338167.1 PLP-dependent transferase [Acidobacteriota bacterium]MBU1473246.1 PLP-dependent transferase [Acidobacteriota bacterium]MBU4253145.1 PLP-dependent transferase [Acidobacteriota bacterium]
MTDDTSYSPGVQKYIEEAKKNIARQEAHRAVMKTKKFDTIAVHGLYSVEEALNNNQGAVIEPLYLSASQAYRDSDELEAALAYLIPTWCYTRIANPSTYYLEWALALLEGYGTGCDTSCCVTASGMAAITSAVDPFLIRQKEGEPMNFVTSVQVYGGTYQLFSIRKMAEQGVDVRWVAQPENIDEWKEKIDENTRFLYVEAPSNPQQSFCDVKAVADLAHSWGIPFIFDATCATPALLRPIAYGVDIVIHSLTKSITSGGLAIGGCLTSRKPIVTKVKNDHPLFKESFAEYVKFLPYRDTGPAASPVNAIYALNDLRLLRIKMDLFSRNCHKVAAFLQNHSRVYQVDYLGLPDFHLHSLAKRYMKLVDSNDGSGGEVNRYGHLMSFRVDGPPANARKVFDGFEMIFRATDLGRIKSVATIPAISTHLQQGEEARNIADVPPQLIRLCVGGEDPDDVITDVDQALNKL